MAQETIFEQSASQKNGSDTDVLDAIPFSDDEFSESEDHLFDDVEESDEPVKKINDAKEKPTVKGSRAASARLGAGATVPALDYTVAMLASVFSGREMKDHRMDEDFKKEFENAVALWAEDEAIDWLSPRYVVITMLFGYLTLTIVNVISERKKRKSVNRKIISAVIDKNIDAASEEEEERPRLRYEVDAKGFYMYNNRGVHIKGKKTERPTVEIMNTINDCKKRGLSPGATNDVIRKSLGINFNSNY